MSNPQTMKIQTEQDMNEFCENVNSHGRSFYICIDNNLGPYAVDELESLRRIYDDFPGAQLKQGIKDISFSYASETLKLEEQPLIHPFAKTPEDKPELKGSMTGVLINCFDTQKGLALLQLRGKNIESEYGLQNAAAGFGQFRRTLQETASTELTAETGIEYAKFLLEGEAVDLLHSMVGGYPQTLASFTFETAFSRLTNYNALDQILEFRENILEGIREGHILSKKEAHPFTVSYGSLEKVAGELNDQGRFYGPVYNSIIDSQRALNDAEVLS